MPTWNPTQYLRFAEERIQPCRDLVARLVPDSPRRVVDLGCGPGNSTEVLARRWPGAEITGVDRSADMIREARARDERCRWEEGDIATWTAHEAVDLLFSNAALHWVPDHARLFPHLLARVACGGAFAWQMPANYDGLAHRLMRELAASPEWRTSFPESPREWFAHQPTFYYDLLAPMAARLELWTTEYIHVLEGPEAITEWYKGTGLRPYLDILSDAAARARFLADYTRSIATAYPRRADGCVLFPFLRQFGIAYRA